MFAGLSLVLSVIGIYGVMVRREPADTRVGILRRSARRGDVLGLVVMQGVRLTLMGVCSLPVARGHEVDCELAKVSPTDRVTFTVVLLLLAAAALLASYCPRCERRASIRWSP